MLRGWFPGLNPYLAEDEVFYSRKLENASGKAQTRNPLISSQVLYCYSYVLLISRK